MLLLKTTTIRNQRLPLPRRSCLFRVNGHHFQPSQFRRHEPPILTALCCLHSEGSPNLFSRQALFFNPGPHLLNPPHGFPVIAALTATRANQNIDKDEKDIAPASPLYRFTLDATPQLQGP